jgi:hypothetical protein
VHIVKLETQFCVWEPLVAEDAVTELLVIDLPELQRQTEPVTSGADDRNLYRASAIADWVNERFPV